MDQWNRREVLKMGALAPIGVASLHWKIAGAQENLALNRAAWASSSVDFISTGHMSTDGQLGTHWQSADDDLQWIYADLGTVCNVHSIVLRWGANHALAYHVQTSTDHGPSVDTGFVEGWTDVHATGDGRGGVEQIPLPGTSARYVRLLLSERAKTGGYTLSSFEVNGTGGPEAAPLSTPQLEPDGSIRLSSGWRLMNHAYIAQEAEKVSMLGYNDADWMAATVPGTVLTSYLNVGAVPDLFYGDHQLQVSDFFAHTNWWYRTEVEVPPSFQDRRTWLKFDGINYRAFIYVNGKSMGNINGAFTRGLFDISEAIVAGKKNCIAVLILPVPKPDKVNVKTLTSGYTWPEEYPKNEPTILAAASWDWLPTIRDRDTGIWNHVSLNSSGDVTIHNPFAMTHFPKPQDLSRAEITLKLELTNHSGQARNGILKCQLGELRFSEPVTLKGGETRSLSLHPSTHPQLTLIDPKLWWPSGYGEQHLYDLTLEFECDGKISDTHTSRIGIREFTYNQPSLTRWDLNKLENVEDRYDANPKDPLTIFCNGQRIFVRGVNWGMDEGMLRCDRQGYVNRLRMEKEMNFNLIRNWAGNLDKPEFFELCDEYGLMVWEEFGIAQQLSPDNPEMWLANARDRFLRRRNHACVVLWCAANESIPEDPILSAMPKLTEELDGTRLLLQCSTQIPPTNGDGPYTAKPPSYYFRDLARGFRPELGSPTVPCVESMRRMMPHNKLWPVNDLWGMHDWWLGNGWDGAGICGPTQTAIATYGVPDGIEDFCRKAAMVSMEAYKAIYESWKDRMWNDCTGVMIWMSNPAWPSLSWNTYDYYMEPTAAYFACRNACEPVHIQWNCVTNQVKVVNCTFDDLKNLNTVAEIYNMDGSLFARKSATLDCPANSVHECLQLFQTSGPSLDGLSNVHFIRLTLTSQDGKPLSSNFYWRGKTEWKYDELRTMQTAHVTGTLSQEKDGHFAVEIENRSAGIALMTRLKAVDLSTGFLVAPIIYSDNYFSLTGHEFRRIDLRFTARRQPAHAVAILVEGWNVAPLELGRIRV